MTFKEILPAPGAKTRDIPTEDLRSFVNDFPALLWRIEIAKSRIEFLNNHVIEPLGDGTRLVLQSAEYRDGVLIPEDAPLMASFLDAVKDGRTMATVFRVRARDGETLWLKLTGAINSRDPRYYYGYLLDIRDTAKVIQDIMDNETEARLRIDNAPDPVFLVEFATRRLHAANAAARELFRLPKSFRRAKMELAGIQPRTMARPMERVLDGLPSTRFWEGTLEYKLPCGATFAARTTLRYVAKRDKGLVRIALNAADTRAATKALRDPDPAAVPLALLDTERLKTAKDAPSLLSLAMADGPMSEACDALMYSDIQARKNIVVVYGAGGPLQGMDQGESFQYQGTIAEDIVRFDLDHLEVEDTMDSIKPIDWALFIPKGIRSYYAKPFFERGTLRTVLIMCSTEPDHFSGNTPDAFSHLLTPLAKLLRPMRGQQRKN